VKLCAARGDTTSLAVYTHVLQAGHRAGGDLPVDREELAAVLGMPRRIVERGLKLWLERGKLREEDGRLFNARVRLEVERELAFREAQVESGRKGGLVRSERLAQGKPSESLKAASSPPAPAPSAKRQTPAPAPLEAQQERLASLVHEAVALDPEHRDERQLLALFTAFETRAGRSVRGVLDPARLTPERLLRSIDDAEAVIAQWKGNGRGA